MPRSLRIIAALGLLTLTALSLVAYEASSRERRGDLASFLHSGASYREGLNPYADNPGVEPAPFGDALNLNPPVTVYAFAALSDVDLLTVRNIFIAGSVVMMAVAFAVCDAHKRPLQTLALCATTGHFFLFWGQIYAPLVLAACLAWRFLPRYQSGVFMGALVAIKPNFVLWPVALFVAGHWRVAAVAVAVAGAISAVPLVIDGQGIYRQWFEFSAEWDLLDIKANFAARRFTSELGLEPLGGWALSLAIAAALCLWSWRAKPSMQTVSTLALPAVLLIGPASWTGYIFFLIPILLSRNWNPAIWTGVLLLVIPRTIVDPHFPLAYAWGALLIACGIAWNELGWTRGDVRRWVGKHLLLSRPVEGAEGTREAGYGDEGERMGVGATEG